MMYNLNVYLTQPEQNGDDPLSLDEQRMKISVLNMLLDQGYSVYIRDPISGNMTPITKLSGKTINLTQYPIWANKVFKKIPHRDIDELHVFRFAKFNLQKY